MAFPVKVKRLALLRQSKQDGYGSWCAGCGVSLYKKKENPVPRIPFSEGGRKNANNCVIFCPDCYLNMKKSGEEEMPSGTIPYYKTSPPNWENEKRR
jgi:hypothetical protein